MSCGEIVGIVEDRGLDDPVYKQQSSSVSVCSGGGAGAAGVDPKEDGPAGLLDATGSMVRDTCREGCLIGGGS